LSEIREKMNDKRQCDADVYNTYILPKLGMGKTQNIALEEKL
jgi:hypothetical protein